jgi:hypothetical protein
MRYDWEVRRVPGSKLEANLEEASAKGWDVFSILPAGEDPNAPANDRVQYAVVVRRAT